MPYILLIIGVLIGIYALYRFMLSANAQQVRALILTGIICALMLAAFVLAVTGRFPAAIALVAACVPFAMRFIKLRSQERDVNTIIEIDAEEIKDDDDEKDGDSR